METIRQVIERAARERRERDFLVSDPDGRRLSYAELGERVASLAGRLHAVGARPGDRVALLLPGSPELVLAFLAAPYGGLVANPLNPRLTAAEIVGILGHSRATVLITDAAHADVVTEARARLPELRSVLSLDAPFPGAELFAPAGHEAAPPTSRPAASDIAMLLYTSGTTGRSKGAAITHRNLATNVGEVARWLDLGPSDRFLCVMPLFHANGLVLTILTPLHLGATVVLPDRFHATTFWETVDRHRPTLFGSVATMLSMLLARPDPPARLRRDSLRYALCGSAPVPLEVIERFEARFGVPVVEGYGLTESTCRATFNPPARRRPGSIGLPIGNELRVVDEAGRECAALETGEIWLRGDNVMPGYFDDPEATRAAFTADGWLRTNDLAYRDADGFLFVVGRKTDMIIRGGENVYPREIEEVLHRHPAVAEAAVFGVPDPLYGEEIAAAVVLREDAAASEDDLRAHCAPYLAIHKRPRSFRFVAELPKGPTGKIAKARLRAESLR